jgi:hypothetical protein
VNRPLQPAILIRVRDGVPCAICGTPTAREVDPAIIGGIGIRIVCSAHAQSIILDAAQTAHWYDALRIEPPVSDNPHHVNDLIAYVYQCGIGNGECSP